MAEQKVGSDPPVAATAGARSPQHLLVACCLLLVGFALLLVAASLAGDRLRQPLDRIPLATYAALRGIALPSHPTIPPGAGRRAPTPHTAPPTPRTSVGADPALVAEVEAAYLVAWEVWAVACLRLDPVSLEGVFAPPELDRAREYVRQLRASGRALRLDAAHRVTVLEFDGDNAFVLDELTDRSLYVDPATRRPLPSGAQPSPTGTERLHCRLRRTETGWRIIDITWGR